MKAGRINLIRTLAMLSLIVVIGGGALVWSGNLAVERTPVCCSPEATTPPPTPGGKPCSSTEEWHRKADLIGTWAEGILVDEAYLR